MTLTFCLHWCTCSITKALVCATILTLQDRGLLDIDQPLAAHLPEWGDTPEKAVITLKHVMCHTSGTV